MPSFQKDCVDMLVITHTDTQTHTDTHRHTHRHTDTQTHRHTHTHTITSTHFVRDTTGDFIIIMYNELMGLPIAD